MFEKLEEYIQSVENNFNTINSVRRVILDEIANYISSGGTALNFICTHNSRRSQFGQVWAAAAAHFYNINIASFSGGTEETAFNKSAIKALENAGFRVEMSNENNPEVELFFSKVEKPIVCSSKTIDSDKNPKNNFAAIMTCNHADENCPFVPGAEKRFPLTFIDPKVSDGTPEEAKVYSERCFEIATEIFYIFKQAKNNLHV